MGTALLEARTRTHHCMCKTFSKASKATKRPKTAGYNWELVQGESPTTEVFHYDISIVPVD